MHSGQIFVIIVVGLITSCVTLSMFAQAWGESRKTKAQADAPPRLESIEARLARLEGAIESVAVEMERVAEGQRFTARLLSERVSEGQPAPRPASQSDRRSITPH